MIDIVIPMAGRGSRFVERGYELPKPLIDVAGKPMIQRVIENLAPDINHRFIFLVLKEHIETYGIEDKLKSWAGSNAEVVVVDQVTEGAACTVLLAQEFLSEKNDLMIANSDQIIDISVTDYIVWSRGEGLDGSIMVFEDNDPKWSFAKLDGNGFVVEVAEKNPISNLATVGIYYFNPGSDFVKYANQMIGKNIRVNGEFYVCPVYNEWIAEGKKIKTWKISKQEMHGVGTPDDLNIYLDRIS